MAAPRTEAGRRAPLAAAYSVKAQDGGVDIRYEPTASSSDDNGRPKEVCVCEA